jgi:hypothetical protein
MEGQRITVDALDYDQIRGFALLIFGMTPASDSTKARKQDMAWSLARAQQLVCILKQEIGIIHAGEKLNGGVA